MTKKHIKQLVLASYKNNNLDEDTIERIANLLSKKDLKEYITKIKQQEKKQTVMIVLPYMPDIGEQKKITQHFLGKKIMYMIDSSLMVGIKVIDNDLISEYNLKNTLEDVANHVKQTND